MQKNLSIGNIFAVFCIISLLLSGISLLALSSIAERHAESIDANQNRYNSYLLADQLRQSSDDLTRAARTYVITGDPRYEQEFREVQAIRNGLAPRPLHYERSYWDFVDAGMGKVRPDGPAIALLELMRQAGFSDAELAKLKQSKTDSEALTRTEAVAMNAIKGRFDDGSGKFARTGPPDAKLARSLMYDDDYMRNKARIMVPITDFMQLLDARTASVVAKAAAGTRTAYRIAVGALVISALGSMFLLLLVYRNIKSSLKRTTRWAEKVARGDLVGEIVIDRDDEVGRLMRAMNVIHTNLANQLSMRNSIIESLPYAFSVRDADNRYLTVNQILETSTGLTRDQMIGKTCAELGVFDRAFAEELDRLSAQALMDGNPTRAELPFELNGAKIGLYSITPFRLADGSIGGTSLAVVDITDMRAAEAQVRAGDLRMRGVTDNLAIVVYEATIFSEGHAKYSFVGGNTKLLAGITPEEIMRSDPIAFVRAFPEERAALAEKFWDCYRRFVPFSEDFRVYQPGPPVWRRTCSSPRREADGTVSSVGYWLDTTAEHLQEEALTAARDAAEAANRAKASFLAKMSHEIRTPMNGVIGMIDVLHQSSLQGFQVEMVDLIRESAFSLLTIIDDILDFSKIEAGGLEIESVPMSAVSVMEKVCGLLDHLAYKKNVELTLFTDPAIPAQMLGDSLRLRQILINLINNAVKFSSEQPLPGRVSVRAQLVTLDPDQVVLDFHVADNGIGMDEETQSRLFKPFAQADASTTRRFGGTGLGLAISHNLAALMGGDIRIRSAPGAGSTFTLRLPYALGAEPLQPAQNPHDVGGLSCLVVGSARSMAPDFAAYLAHEGALVEQAPDITEAGKRMASASGMWLWVIDAADGAPLIGDWRAVALAGAGQGNVDVRFVVVGRGPRRHPYMHGENSVIIDGNALNRHGLLKAVALAAGREKEEEAPHAGKTHAKSTLITRDMALAQGRLILVAEDNETNRKVILNQLALLGYAADVRNDGSQALESWRSGDYALLLTDLHMPVMDGYQLTTAIRAEENHAGPTPIQIQIQIPIPIVALTANALRSEAERCINMGMNDYVSKPVQLADLRNMLEKWLPAAPTVGAVDVSVLGRLVGNNQDLMQELLAEFCVSAVQIAGELQAAVRAGDVVNIAAAAHKLKSPALSVGAMTLGALCGGIEEACLNGSPEPLSTLVLELGAELTSVNAHIGAWLLEATLVS